MSGYVRTHREALEHPVFQDDWLWRLFSWCLLKANWRPARFRGVDLQPGQFVTGRIRASEELHVSPSKWYRGIKKLESAQYGCIKAESNNEWTIITVINWQTYQSDDDSERTTSGQPANNERTTNEQRADTIEKEQTLQEGKKGRHKGTAEPLPPIPEALNTPEFVEAWTNWIEHRRQRKPALTTIAVKQQLENLEEWGPQRAVAAIRHSIGNNWQGIFEKGGSNGTQRTFAAVGPGQRFRG